MTRFRDKYIKEVVPALIKEFGYTNPYQVPRITKAIVNSGVGRATSDSKHLDQVVTTLTTVTGQKPVVTVAKKSIASFKLRDGNKIGTSVTLRGAQMDNFLDLVISVALPRVRDFRGISDTAFDAQGNYSLGLPDQSIFPQIPYEDTAVVHGLQINIVTTAKTPAEARQLLKLMGFPFRRNE